MVLNSVLLGDKKAQNSKTIKKTNLIPSYLSVIFLFFKNINQFIIILNINILNVNHLNIRLGNFTMSSNHSSTQRLKSNNDQNIFDRTLTLKTL